jgi:aspartate-semialdehyde dehydrogenase
MMKVAIIGVTGMVGNVMLKVLEERNFPVDELIPVASERSVGQTIQWKGQEFVIRSLEQAVKEEPQVALFSAGGDVSLEWAPRFAEVGSLVVDNSSAWRMDPDKKLIVPEVNGHLLDGNERIIPNPNCSTIQLVVALAPLHEQYGLERVVVSTYQSISGTGAKAVAQLADERAGRTGEKVYPHPIDMNALPHCDVFLENGYTKEEMKVVWETRKILSLPELKVTCTAVRIPTQGGHSESVNIRFRDEFDLEEVRNLLETSAGISLQDDPSANLYPMPIYAEGKDDVFVGRIRRDESEPRSLNLWVVSDNLRKGAATNTVQIAEYFQKQGWLA